RRCPEGPVPVPRPGRGTGAGRLHPYLVPDEVRSGRKPLSRAKLGTSGSTVVPLHLVRDEVQEVSQAGRVNETLAPPWARFSAQIVPPWASTSPRAIASPSPLPPPERARSARQKRSNIRPAASGGRPEPVSS